MKKHNTSNSTEQVRQINDDLNELKTMIDNFLVNRKVKQEKLIFENDSIMADSNDTKSVQENQADISINMLMNHSHLFILPS